MKRTFLVLGVLATFLPSLIGADFTLKITGLDRGQISVLATNISGNIRGYCVFETSSNLVTWTPAVTNLVQKTWSTNTFTITNPVMFYRAWVY